MNQLIINSVSSSGLFTLIAVSWYAARVINDFYDSMYGGVRSVTPSLPPVYVYVCVF